MSKPRPITVIDTVIPPPPSSSTEPGPSSYATPSDGYFRPRDTLNRDVIKSAEPVGRTSSVMQMPRQLLLTPQEHNSWTLMDKSPRSPVAIVISPPSEEHLATIDYSSSQPLPKHRRSMAKAACLAFFICLVVVGLVLYLFFS